MDAKRRYGGGFKSLSNRKTNLSQTAYNNPQKEHEKSWAAITFPCRRLMSRNLGKSQENEWTVANFFSGIAPVDNLPIRETASIPPTAPPRQTPPLPCTYSLTRINLRTTNRGSEHRELFRRSPSKYAEQTLHNSANAPNRGTIVRGSDSRCLELFRCMTRSRRACAGVT